MYEDWQVEADVFPEEGRVFCIASAGETSMALAARGNDSPADRHGKGRLTGSSPLADDFCRCLGSDAE